MILIMWIILVFTCFTEKNHVSSNSNENGNIKRREAIEEEESSERESSPNELFSINSPISNPISLNSRGIRSATFPPIPEDGSDENYVNITSEILALGLQLANVTLQKLRTLEKTLKCLGIMITEGDTPEFGRLQFLKTTAQSLKIAEIGLIQDFASRAIKETLQLTADQALASLSRVTINPISGCPPPPSCTEVDNFYRRHDGGCNNLRYTHWGKSFTPYLRKTKNTYADGLSIPRISVVNGDPLPSARRISSNVAVDVDKPSSEFTLSVMEFGQFIEHDLTQSSIPNYDATSGILCCGSSGPQPASQFHPECYPIEIPVDDPFYSANGSRCMNFIRSLPAPNANCNTLGSRNQLNKVTHYLDGSAVYGSTEEDANILRQFTGGLLTVRPRDFLPDDNSTTVFDFLAGNDRVNFEPQLSVIQTIWAREHNRVAKKLAQLNSTWDDETIYQETRKIIVAEIQHIVYNEWLPLIIGPAKMNEYGLFPRKCGFFTNYTDELNPNIFNEFGTVAVKFKLTLMQGNLKLYDSNNINNQTLELSNNFGKPENVITPPEKFDEFVRGLYLQPMQEFDNYVADDLTNKLFKTTENEGLDWVAIVIQKGRDHGIGTYNNIRKACLLNIANNFESLNSSMEPSTVEAFQSLYASVEDLDAFIAGISEKPVPGGIVGDTFNCIITHQFYKLKNGDRFYYENGGLPSSFTSGQLNEIRKVSWARILCDNVPNIKEIQPFAFRLTDTSQNAKVRCTNTGAIPTVNINQWLK